MAEQAEQPAEAEQPDQAEQAEQPAKADQLGALKRAFKPRVVWWAIAVALPIACALGEYWHYQRNPQEGFIFTERQSLVWAAYGVVFLLFVTDLIVLHLQNGTGSAPANAQADHGEADDATADGDAAPVARTAEDEVQEEARQGSNRADAAAANVATRRAGVKALFVGTDGRASTSKFEAGLWSLAVLYVFLVLLLAGRTLHAPSDCGGKHPQKCTPADVSSIKGAFDHEMQKGLQPEYFALLGIPLGAAVAAKALTTNKVANQDLVKSAPDANAGGAAAAAAELVGNDANQADTLDFQYVLFNLFLLIYFAVQFFTHIPEGLPDLPATLLALAGVSGLAYTTKKALETGVTPQISATDPERILLHVDSGFDILGSGFLSAGGSRTKENRVNLDGRPVPVRAGDWHADRISVTLPQDVAVLKKRGFRARSTPSTLAQLVVFDDQGTASQVYKVEVDVPPGW
jgi:hypothetical protein